MNQPNVLSHNHTIHITETYSIQKKIVILLKKKK